MNETRLLCPADVANAVGCSGRGACAIIRHILGEADDPGRAYGELRVSASAFDEWMRFTRWLPALPLWRFPKGEVGCYFIASGDDVKIGVSSDVGRRLAEVQKCNPRPVQLLGVFHGGAATEAYYHGMFRKHRLHGEWYAVPRAALAALKLRREAA